MNTNTEKEREVERRLEREQRAVVRLGYVYTTYCHCRSEKVSGLERSETESDRASCEYER